jgi:hydroxymethylglutaryl-CoA reductase (NADPH)
MLGASFLPARLRHEHNHTPPSNPGYVNRQITRILQTVARSAFIHPIHTIVFVALLASTSYVGVLEGSLFDRASSTSDAGGTDFSSLAEGAKRLRLGQETSWKWQTEQSGSGDASPERDTSHWKPLGNSQDTEHMMVMTLVFPDSLSNTAPRIAPSAIEVLELVNSSAKHLPTTWNPLSPISQDTALAFAVPSDEAVEFARSIHELPNKDHFLDDDDRPQVEAPSKANRWVMKAATNGKNPAQPTMRLSAKNTWIGFVDLLKVQRSLSTLRTLC